jgi:hypothetical protein
MQQIVYGAASVREILPSEEIERILASAATKDNPLGYAYVAGRNAGIDIKRYRDSQIVKSKLTIERERAATRRATLNLAAIEELNQISAHLVEAGYNPQHLEVFAARYLQHIPVSVLMRQYGVSRDVIYQWAHRAGNAIVARASAALKCWLQARSTLSLDAVMSALRQSEGNIKHAASLLGVDAATLRRTMRNYAIPRGLS